MTEEHNDDTTADLMHHYFRTGVRYTAYFAPEHCREVWVHHERRGWERRHTEPCETIADALAQEYRDQGKLAALVFFRRTNDDPHLPRGEVVAIRKDGRNANS